MSNFQWWFMYLVSDAPPGSFSVEVYQTGRTGGRPRGRPRVCWTGAEEVLGEAVRESVYSALLELFRLEPTRKHTLSLNFT